MRYKVFPMSNITFGEWLKEKREKRRLSQTELAGLIGVKPAQVSRIESGGRGTSMDILVKLSDIFHAPVEDLVRMVSGHIQNVATDQIIKKSQKILTGYKKEETKKRALEFLEYLAIQEEQSEYNADSSQRKISKTETT